MDSQIQLLTERLQLRQIQMTDAEALFSYRSDKLVNQYQGWIPKSLYEVTEFISHKTSREVNVPGTWTQLGIFRKEDHKLIGDIGIHFHTEDSCKVEIGYTLNSLYHGQGYATEALKEVVCWLFNGLNKERIIASLDPRNQPSIRLVERLGFKKQAHFIQNIYNHGEWVDELVYVLVKEKKQLRE